MKWFLSLFAWREVMQKGPWVYYENTITKKRKVERIYQGYCPIDRAWLDGR